MKNAYLLPSVSDLGVGNWPDTDVGKDDDCGVVGASPGSDIGRGAAEAAEPEASKALAARIEADFGLAVLALVLARNLAFTLRADFPATLRLALPEALARFSL